MWREGLCKATVGACCLWRPVNLLATHSILGQHRAREKKDQSMSMLDVSATYTVGARVTLTSVEHFSARLCYRRQQSCRQRRMDSLSYIALLFSLD